MAPPINPGSGVNPGSHQSGDPDRKSDAMPPWVGVPVELCHGAATRRSGRRFGTGYDRRSLDCQVDVLAFATSGDWLTPKTDRHESGR